jgi:hypothetical protein
VNGAVNVMLGCSAAGLAAAVWNRYGKDRWMPPKIEGETPFRAGSKAPSIGGVDYSARDKTLVLFLSAYCHYCRASIGFYNELDRRARASSGRLLIVPVFPEAKQAVERFQAAERLEPGQLTNFDYRGFGVRVTPTALLVGRNGNVEGSWAGSADLIKRHMRSVIERSL